MQPPNVKKPYISSVDGLPAYRTVTDLFVNPSKTTCCLNHLSNSRKEEGLNLLKDVLYEFGKKYDTEYTIINIKDSNDYLGKRRSTLPILCSKHNFITTRKAETLKRQVIWPCNQCRMEYDTKKMNFELVNNKFLKKEEVSHRVFRLRTLDFFDTCVLTGANFEGKLKKHIHAHHINSVESYPKLAGVVQFNCLSLLDCVHSCYHSKFLGDFNFDYDDVNNKLSYPKVANLYTFIAFLKQLKRDLLLYPNNSNTLLFSLNSDLEVFWNKLKMKNETEVTYPSITEEKLNNLINLLNNDTYQDFFLKQPETETFLSQIK